MALMLARRAMRTMVYEVAPADGRATNHLTHTGLICAIGGVCWVELIRWVDSRRLLEEKTTPSIESPKSDEKPPTLTDLFKSDLPHVMKMTDEDRLSIEWKDLSVLKIKTQAYLDFQAKVQFVGFYIPTSPHTFDACLALVDSVRSTIEDLPKRVAVSAGYRSEQTKIEDLVFSGRVLLYHEDFLSIPQQAAAIATYSARGFDVNFRGPDYLGDQVVAWHHQRAAKGAK